MTSRTPTEARPGRMEPLACLPVFFALKGKRAVVAGGSAAAAWKAELLIAAGAAVEVYAADPGEEMCEIADEGGIAIHRRAIGPADFKGAALAVGAFDSDEASAFAALARRSGVPVNVIDKPAFCDFSFGSIVNRSPLVIGISTDGAAPVFAQAIRAKLEAMIPRGFARWAAAAKRWRPRVQALVPSFGARKRLWERFTERAISEPERIPDEIDFRKLTHDLPETGAGSVTLVGAGPGDPELLTLRALRALQSADVILIDDLVSPQVLDFARREAKKMMVGKTGHGPACRQSEINDLTIKLAKTGKRVVRLKGGDPLIFGRAGEEIAACRAANVPVEVVPGISAAQGAASRLLVSLTHRSQAHKLQYITGHDRDGKLPADMDWSSLADPAATTIVYMPKKTLGGLSRRAISEGLDPSTPAYVITNATRPNEEVIASTIAGIASDAAARAQSGPAIVIIGRVLELVVAEKKNTFWPEDRDCAAPRTRRGEEYVR
jgi:uroporphyrin-III C-methyltransferase/precorrin-2 dehydrogenase/sirohydrochlorin ferrochelatase